MSAQQELPSGEVLEEQISGFNLDLRSIAEKAQQTEDLYHTMRLEGEEISHKQVEALFR